MTASHAAADPGPAATLSVVIPLFNKSEWIEETLRSVLAQTFRPDEILIVDDGSTDDGREIVERIGGAAVRLLGTPSPQSGSSAARNLGIRAASSDWIAFLDADDLWSPDYLAKVIGAILDHRDAGCIFSSRTVERGGGTSQHPPLLSRDVRTLDLEAYLDLWLATGRKGLSPMHSSAVVIRKAVLQAAGLFPEGRNRGEDKDTWLRVMARTSAAFLPEPLVRYRADVPGQLNRSSPPLQAPPLLDTAMLLARSPELSSKVRAKLLKLARREAWLYAKRRRLRPLDATALAVSDVRSGPLHTLGLRTLYAAGMIAGRFR